MYAFRGAAAMQGHSITVAKAAAGGEKKRSCFRGGKGIRRNCSDAGPVDEEVLDLPGEFFGGGPFDGEGQV
jgi:hypothetical protein